MGAHRPAPRIQDDHELDSDITLFSHYLIENPLNPRVFGSWIRSSEAGLGRHMRRIHELSISKLVEDTGLCENTIRSKLRRTLKAFETIVEQRGYRDLLFRCD